MAVVSQSHRATPPAPVALPASVPVRKLSFPALGTVCEVQYAAPGGDTQAATFEQAATAWVNAFEAKYSRFRPDSLLSRINAAAGQDWVHVDAEMEAMLKLCDTLFFMTQGILDPTALPLMRLWNYKADTPRVPASAEIETARALVGWRKVQRSPGKVFLPEKGMALDFCEAVGLELPALSAATHDALASQLPVFSPPSNPLDLTAQAMSDTGLYRRVLEQISRLEPAPMRHHGERELRPSRGAR